MKFSRALAFSIAAALAAAIFAAAALLADRGVDGQSSRPRGGRGAGKASTGTVFRPGPTGDHTCWLVAGPFEKPLADPGGLAAAREGGKLAGSPWQLVASPQQVVTLPRAGQGLFYASGALRSNGGERLLLVVSGGPVRAWLGGKLVGQTQPGGFGAEGLHTGSFRTRLPPGDSRLVLEVAAGEDGARFACAFRESDGEAEKPSGEPLVLSLADAGKERLLKLLADSLELKCDEVWLKPGRMTMRLERAGSAPQCDGELYLTSGRAGCGVLASALLAGPFEQPVPQPEEKCLQFEASVTAATHPFGAALRRFSVRLYSREGIDDEAKNLYAETLAAGREANADGLALARLKAEKALLLVAVSYASESDARQALDELAAGREALAAAAALRDGLAGRIGWIERAYRCPLDGSVQPYRLYVPRDLADPAERQAGRFPLVVYLHGYVSSYDKHSWVEEGQMRDFCANMEQAGCILLLPFGRSNTDFVSIGEADVLQAIEAACRLYPVDRDRVYLFGYSMGGYGAYAIAAHYPDRFAGMLALSGRPVPYYVEQQGREKQPRYKGWCLDVDCPLALSSNLAGVPTLICHSTEDFIPIESARKMHERLQALGGKVELKEFKGDHWTGFEFMCSPEPLAWLLANRRAARPAAVTVRAYSPRYGKNSWASIDVINKWTEPAELAAAETSRGFVKISAKNVREFTLSGVAAGPGRPATSGANGFWLDYTHRGGGVWEIRGRLKGEPRCGQWVKDAALPGPMKEACNTPFVVVWGSNGSPDETLDNARKAERFAAEWHRFAKGLPQVTDEKKLTDEEKQTRSLILFGTPQTSALARQAEQMKALECRLTAESFEVAGRKASLAGGRGVVLTRPNPWAPSKSRYLVICAGRFYGEGLAENHKLDLIPDFIVFGPGREGEGEPPAVLAGFFDSNWQSDPRLVETFERP